MHSQCREYDGNDSLMDTIKPNGLTITWTPIKLDTESSKYLYIYKADLALEKRGREKYAEENSYRYIEIMLGARVKVPMQAR